MPTYSRLHYGDVIMGAIASQITSLTIVYSTVYSDADQRKHQSSASLASVRGIHRGPVNPRTNGQLRGKCSIWWRHHETIGNKCPWNWNQNTTFSIPLNGPEIVIREMAALLFPSQCVNKILHCYTTFMSVFAWENNTYVYNSPHSEFSALSPGFVVNCVCQSFEWKARLDHW